MDRYECHICKSELTGEELRPYYNPEHSKETLVCKNHWCECLPESTPWRWIRFCDHCENMTICKSCYSISGNDNICKTCWKLKGKLENSDDD